MPTITTETDDTAVIFTKSAVDTMIRMREQAAMVDAAWGQHRPELARKTTTSLMRQICTLVQSNFGSDAVRVHRDDDLSFFVSAGIGFGIIFHPTHYRVDAPQDDDSRLVTAANAHRMGRYCYGTDGDCWEPYRNGEPTCTGHESRSVAMPVPGEWSFHS